MMLLGFSGGGQFVHRYLAFHEGMISRAVIGTPGWFMWSDLSHHYPLDLANVMQRRRPSKAAPPNRYAPDYYECFVPKEDCMEVDLLARSGIIGKVKTKNSLIENPTKVTIIGYICTTNGHILNTTKCPMIAPKSRIKKSPRSPLTADC